MPYLFLFKAKVKVMKTKQHPNLSAYDNVEKLTNFSESSFIKYCDEKLESCFKHSQFIQKNCVDQDKFWSGKICEIGSGNSKLLYRLEKDSLLTEGVGYEISSSRYKFAEEFKSYANCQKVTNINKNIFDSPPLRNFDIVLAVDIVIQLIAPINKNLEKDIMNWVNQSLKPGGFFILELWDFEHILKQLELFQNKLKIWEELPISDPWEFILSNISKDEKNDIIWEKLFLKRNSLDRSKFINILRPYSRSQISIILKDNGFDSVKIYNKWLSNGDTDQGEYIVLAQKIYR